MISTERLATESILQFLNDIKSCTFYKSLYYQVRLRVSGKLSAVRQPGNLTFRYYVYDIIQ